VFTCYLFLISLNLRSSIQFLVVLIQVYVISSDQILNHLIRVLGRGIILLLRGQLFGLEKY